MKPKKNLITGLLFISPWIIGFLAFTFYPMISSLYYSLTEYNIISEPKFVGFQNYIDLFTNDRNFYKVLYNSAYMLVFGVSLTVISALLIAILLNSRKIRGLSVFRVAFFIPTLMPTVIISILWVWMYQPESGLINGFLSILGIEGPSWLISQVWSKPSFILMFIWGSGNYIILFLAGLQEVPVTLYESVEIDGGNAFYKLWYITLPHLKPVILFNLITAIINSLQYFSEPYIMTDGGPNVTTELISLYLYRNAFMYSKMGYACAIAWIILCTALGLTLVLIRSMKLREAD